MGKHKIIDPIDKLIELFDLDVIKKRITMLSGVEAVIYVDPDEPVDPDVVVIIDDESLTYVLRLVIRSVLAYTQRERLNPPLMDACVELVALNWLKQYFLSTSENVSAEDALLVGDVLSISEGDTRIAYQNRAQVDGIGASWGSYAYIIENVWFTLKRYRRLHWGTRRDWDYG